jgi:lipid-A-disaccharide synthase-like uncharacterized protein
MMENIITYTIVAMVGLLTMYLLNRYASSNPITDKNNTILVMPKVYLYLGYIGTLFIIVLLMGWLITEGFDSSMLPYLLFYPFMIGGGITVIFTYHRHNVVFDENKISSTNIYGKKSEINWDDISKISFNQFSGMITLSVKNGGKVKMHQHLKGIKIVLDRVKQMNVETGKIKIPNYN